MKRTSISQDNMNDDKGESLVKDRSSPENNQKLKKNLEMCGVHTKGSVDQKESQTVTENFDSTLTNFKNKLLSETDQEDSSKINKQNTFSNDFFNHIHSSQERDTDCNLPNEYPVLGNERKKAGKQLQKTDNPNLLLQEIPQNISPLLKKENKKNQETSKPLSVEQEVQGCLNICRPEDIPETNSQSDLPDILSTLNKSPATDKLLESDVSKSRPDSADIDKGIGFKSKSLLFDTSYLHNLQSSEILQSELEQELKQLNSLHSLQTNQSIYKLAYDENVTDQSDSRSPSPDPISEAPKSSRRPTDQESRSQRLMDPDSQIPKSLINDEIIIYEADSGDEGSEDLELIAHRYESDSFRNGNKHVYTNKLSLAVELLRTREDLPFDADFKRVVEENNVLPGVHTGGKVNEAFVEDSGSSNTFNITNYFKKNIPGSKTANSSSDSAIFSDNSDSMELGFDNEIYEKGTEAVAQSSETQDNSDGIKAGYRRFGVQAGSFFSPRAAFTLSPRICCTIM